MRSFLVLLLLLVSGFAQAQEADALEPSVDQTQRDRSVRVRAHYRADGTYVEAHRRTSPDSSFENNWSSAGNVNPHTGAPGRKTSRR